MVTLTRSSQSSPVSNTADGGSKPYEEIMGIAATSSDSHDIGVGGGASALSSRLVTFREWLTDEAKAFVHPSVCIVNGEATDGTKNAPVLLFGPPPSATTGSNASGAASAGAGRCGIVDGELDQALYDRTIGCQVRVVRELKKDEVMMTMPREAMVTPDLVASSDAGKAVFACCQPLGDGARGFWDAFENTTMCEKKFMDKLARYAGARLLVQILQERKKAELTVSKSMREREVIEGDYKLAEHGTFSTRAPILAFLIHQRFSNEVSPRVSSDGSDALPFGTPSSFAPYVRTLPSAIPLPICWKRNELALLAGCIPGCVALQEVAAQTFLLASEFVALLDAGISHRFPKTFPPGLLTWERWVWAASVFTSRNLPVSCYLNKGQDSSSLTDMQSPPHVWKELGVMVPLLDMLNHETEASQVTWEPRVPPLNDELSGQPESTTLNATSHPPRAIVHKRVKKGSQMYCNYGNLCNQNLILQYGFAQIGNPADEVRIGWGLMDAVGGVPAPDDYIPPFIFDEQGGDNTSSDGLVYESADPACINAWWSESRLALLEKEALVTASFVSLLKAGKKLSAVAYTDGTYHPIFLTAAVIATMPATQIEKNMSGGKSVSRNGQGSGLALTKKHRVILRKYLAFVYTRKLEKLLQNLNNGLKDHFNSVQLWTKVSEKGLHYNTDDANPDDPSCIGWQTFFDSHAYSATMELEKKYYAVGPDSCVLALYDGHLRSLQVSIDGISTLEKFEKSVICPLEELGFVILTDDNEGVQSEPANGKNKERGGGSSASSGKGQQPVKNEEQSVTAGSKGGAGEKSTRRRNRKKGDRPPAIKLHIGNLAYTTKPADLFDFFAGVYGRENVLECHIPTERDSGRSRGFGFVTMPDTVAMKALHSGRKHEIDGRLLKVAESNSAGAGRINRATAAPAIVPRDRCASCGYRPKYCTCAVPKITASNGNSNVYGGHFPTGEELHLPHQHAPIFGNGYGRSVPNSDHYGSGRHRHSWGRRSFSRSLSPRRGRSRSDRDRGYGRDVDSGYRDRYGRSRSRSFSRERDRERERHRRERGGRDRSRDRSSGRRSSRSAGERRGWGRRSSRDRSRSADRSGSRSYSDAPRGRKSIDSAASDRAMGSRMRSLSRSPSPRSNAGSPGSGRKREGHARKRSRSRSRGRSSRRKRRRHARSRSRSLSHSRSMRKE